MVPTKAVVLFHFSLIVSYLCSPFAMCMQLPLLQIIVMGHSPVPLFYQYCADSYVLLWLWLVKTNQTNFLTLPSDCHFHLNNSYEFLQKKMIKERW